MNPNITATIITSLLVLIGATPALFFTVYSAIFERKSYLQMIELYNFIFKDKNYLEIIYCDDYKNSTIADFEYKNGKLIYWGFGDIWSFHTENNCLISSLFNNWTAGLVTCYMYRKINKYLRARAALETLNKMNEGNSDLPLINK